MSTPTWPAAWSWTIPGLDLPLCLALASSLRDRLVPPDLVAIGEVGLLGELRPVPGLERRLREAARLGFRTAIVPESRRGDCARGQGHGRVAGGLDTMPREAIGPRRAGSGPDGSRPTEIGAGVRGARGRHDGRSRADDASVAVELSGAMLG